MPGALAMHPSSCLLLPTILPGSQTHCVRVASLFLNAVEEEVDVLANITESMQRGHASLRQQSPN